MLKNGSGALCVVQHSGSLDSASHFYFFLPDARFGCHPAAALTAKASLIALDENFTAISGTVPRCFPPSKTQLMGDGYDILRGPERRR
jgi:hypothetical protein